MRIKTRPCMVCDRSGVVEVDRAGYDMWQSGTFIQNALPNLTADQREQLMTGTHGECFDTLFSDELNL